MREEFVRTKRGFSAGAHVVLIGLNSWDCHWMLCRAYRDHLWSVCCPLGQCPLRIGLGCWLRWKLWPDTPSCPFVSELKGAVQRSQALEGPLYFKCPVVTCHTFRTYQHRWFFKWHLVSAVVSPNIHWSFHIWVFFRPWNQSSLPPSEVLSNPIWA